MKAPPTLKLPRVWGSYCSGQVRQADAPVYAGACPGWKPEPERYSSFASGAVPAASQPLADDPAVRAVFRNEAVIRRAGGVECLESWLLCAKRLPVASFQLAQRHHHNAHTRLATRLCWHCDNQLRDQFTERLESMATDNCARWVLSVVRRDLGFDDSHVVTMPELCWWLVRNDLAVNVRPEAQPVGTEITEAGCAACTG